MRDAGWPRGGGGEGELAAARGGGLDSRRVYLTFAAI
jgi:hypothetical protein